MRGVYLTGGDPLGLHNTSCGTPACAPFVSIREENAATLIAGRQPGRHRDLEAAAAA